MNVSNDIPTRNETAGTVPTNAPEGNAPKVSVVVPVYNVEQYLDKALHSLHVQTLKNMEFVCVNDGSTDNSLAILKEYAARDSRFRVLNGPNGGYGRAMNRGIDAARGEYLGVLEPDDFVLPGMFAELYAKAVENNADFVKADFYFFRENPDGTLDKQHSWVAGSRYPCNRVLCPLDEPLSFRFAVNTWSGIYRTAFLREWNIRHNETPGASYQDNGFLFKVFCRAKRGYFSDVAYYMYRQDNPNASMASRGKMYAVTAEYRLIFDWLKHDKALLEKAGGAFYAKKINSFFVTLRRLAPQFHPAYMQHMREEFETPLALGLLDLAPAFIGRNRWTQFVKIMADTNGNGGNVCVSVIMPVYNSTKYVRQALDSLLARDEIPFEIICVNDGSTDNSLAILREYEAKDPRVHVLTQSNAGAGAARNTGMKLARGEYLSFLDADDFFEPEMLRMAYERAHAQNADVVVFRCDEYHEDTKQFVPTKWTIKTDILPAKRPFAGNDIPKNIFGAFIGWPWDKLFRADFVRENNLHFQETRTTNDMLFVFSAIVKASRITTMDSVLAHHRQMAGTLSVTRELSWNCFYEALCAVKKQLIAWNLYEHREQDFVNYALHACLWNLYTLRDEAYQKLYTALKNGWLSALDITARDENYFYSRAEWTRLQEILSLSPEEFRSRRAAR